jgi:catechol 2,3-dioxygenase-like lactoylglutathione lyase family enzyme
VKYTSVLLAVRDMERSRRFYREVLGLEVTADFGANVTLTGGISLQTADTWEKLIRRKDDEIVFRNNAAELYFEEDRIGDFAAKLAAMPDIVYVHPLLEHPWGQRAVRFYDPDGHIIEVGENMAAAVQRFLDSGLSVGETAARMDVPEDYVRTCRALRRTPDAEPPTRGG